MPDFCLIGQEIDFAFTSDLLEKNGFKALQSGFAGLAAFFLQDTEKRFRISRYADDFQEENANGQKSSHKNSMYGARRSVSCERCCNCRQRRRFLQRKCDRKVDYGLHRYGEYDLVR